MTNEERIYKNFLGELEEGAKKAPDTGKLLKKLARTINEERRDKMEAEIEAEQAAAAETIRAKYEDEGPASWNEGAKTRAYKKLLQGIRG